MTPNRLIKTINILDWKKLVISSTNRKLQKLYFSVCVMTYCLSVALDDNHGFTETANFGICREFLRLLQFYSIQLYYNIFAAGSWIAKYTEQQIKVVTKHREIQWKIQNTKYTKKTINHRCRNPQISYVKQLNTTHWTLNVCTDDYLEPRHRVTDLLTGIL